MERNNNNNNTLIKILVILGSLAAIFVAAALIYKKYNKKPRIKDTDPFDFDDDFFFDDCEGCFDGDCIVDEATEDVATEDEDSDEDLAF